MTITPLHITPEEVRQWSDRRSRFFHASCLVTKHAPRGKGWLARAAGRLLAPGRKLVMHTAYDALLAIDPQNLDVYTTIAVAPDPSESDVLLGSISAIAEGGVYFDIGANAGYLSLEMIKLFGDKIRVFAFEPQASLAHAIAVSAELNGFSNLTVFSTLVGDKDGIGTLYVGSHSIHASGVAREPGSRLLRPPMVSLDRLISDGMAPVPTVIKVDVEGAERSVFQGAAATLREHHPYLIFESDVNAERFGYNRTDLLRYLHDLAGYRFFGIGVSTFEPEPKDGPSSVLQNILAVGPDQPVPEPRRLEPRRYPVV